MFERIIDIIISRVGFAVMVAMAMAWLTIVFTLGSTSPWSNSLDGPELFWIVVLGTGALAFVVGE